MRVSAFGLLVAAALSAAAQESVDLAEAALRDGMHVLATDFATNAVAMANSPEASSRAFTVLAAAKEQSTNPEDFLSWIESVQEPRPEPAWSYYRARALAANHRYPEAEVVLAKLRENLPGDSPLATPAIIDHAFAQASAGQTGKAIKILERAHKGNPNVSLDLARLLIADGQPDKAVDLLRPLAADTNDVIRSARASLLLAKCGYEAAREDEARRTLAALDPNNETLPRNIRALALASRAIVGSDNSATNAPSAMIADLSHAAVLAESNAVRIDCLATSLEVEARFPNEPDTLAESAAALVADYPRSPTVAESLLAAAKTRLNDDRPADTVVLTDLFLTSISGSPFEYDMRELRAEALSRIPGRGEESAAAFLRCAEACRDSNRATSLRIRSARELHRAGMGAQAAARLEDLLADIPNGPLRDEASLLRATCLAETDAAAALQESLVLSTNAVDEATSRAARLNAGLLVGKTAIESTPEGEDATKTAIALLHGAASSALATDPGAEHGSPGKNASEEVADEAAQNAAIQAQAALAEAVICIRKRDFTRAIDALQMACSLPNGGASVERAYALRPKVFLALGNEKEAQSAYEVFMRDFPESPYRADAQFAMAAHAFNCGRFEESIGLFDDFAKFRTDDPRRCHALYYKSVAQFRLARYKECEETIGRLAGEYMDFPRLPEARFLLGETAAQQIDFGKAALAFASVAEDDSAPAELRVRARLRRADCLYSFAGTDSEAYAKCMRLYDTLLQDPETERAGLRWECLFKRARATEKSGDTVLARDRYYRDLIVPYETAPSGAAAVWYARAADSLADLMLRSGDRTDAIELLGKVVRLDLPGAETARRRLEILQPKTLSTP